MPLWGNTDDAANSAIFAPAQVKLAPNTVNRGVLFANTTPDAFVNNATVGQFGVLEAEMATKEGPIFETAVVNPGSGYTANAVVTVAGDGELVAVANTTTGKIYAIEIDDPGEYGAAPAITIAAPAAQAFDANTTGVVVAQDFIILTGHKFQNADLVTYTVAAGNTAISPLESGEQYYVVSANSTGVKLALTLGGDPLDLAIVEADEEGHSLRGETATGVVYNERGTAGVASPGWVLRTVGSGGRAGRIQFETLVAMKTIEE